MHGGQDVLRKEILKESQQGEKSIVYEPDSFLKAPSVDPQGSIKEIVS